MKVAVWISVVFSLLASGCAMEGAPDRSGSADETSFELTETDRAKLVGAWKTDAGTSIELNRNGSCEYEGALCTFTVSAKGPNPDLTTPWLIDLSLESGKHETLEVCAIESESFVVAKGEGFVDYTKSDESALVDIGFTPVSAKKKMNPATGNVDAIQPFGRTAGRH